MKYEIMDYSSKNYSSKIIKQAVDSLEITARVCSQPIEIRFKPVLKTVGETCNKWRIRVLGTWFIDKDFVIAAQQAVTFLVNAYPDKFKPVNNHSSSTANKRRKIKV